MSWTLALEYVRVLAWPSIVLFLGLVFKRQVVGLFGRLHSVETPVGSITFENQADAVAQEAAEVEEEIAAELNVVETAGQNSTSENGSAADRFPVSDLERQQSIYVERKSSDRGFAVLRRLAESDPTAAVLGAWREVEKSVRQFLNENEELGQQQIQLSSRDFARRGLPTEVVRLVDDLRELRNRAVHTEDVVLTAEGARSYVMAAQRAIDSLALSQLSAMQYEEEVFRALKRVAKKVDHRGSSGGGQSVDFLVEDMANRVAAIEVKFRRNSRLSASDVNNAVGQARAAVGDVGVLVVTNSELVRGVREVNAQPGEPPIEVIRWTGEQDDSLLVRALARVAR